MCKGGHFQAVEKESMQWLQRSVQRFHTFFAGRINGGNFATVKNAAVLKSTA